MVSNFMYPWSPELLSPWFWDYMCVPVPSLSDECCIWKNNITKHEKIYSQKNFHKNCVSPINWQVYQRFSAYMSYTKLKSYIYITINKINKLYQLFILSILLVIFVHGICSAHALCECVCMCVCATGVYLFVLFRHSLIFFIIKIILLLKRHFSCSNNIHDFF